MASDAQLRGWERRFAVYRRPPSVDDIRAWLGRFAARDGAVAERILENVLLVSELEIHAGYRIALESIPGWRARAANVAGRWFFFGFGGAGESGQHMLHKFREANDMTEARFGKMFRKDLRDLPFLRLTDKDTVVFVDDFSGSGQQVVDIWPDITELLTTTPRLFLILTCITRVAYERIVKACGVRPLAWKTLRPSRNVFDPSCGIFSAAEQARLLHYCQLADAERPKGFGECGLLLVLSHKTPNNSLPILHANHDRWVGLFPRNLLRRAEVR